MLSAAPSLLALALAGVVSADYYIPPESVPLATRQNWCDQEKSTCPLICMQTQPGTTLQNDCDPKTLTYGCLCGNNMQPNMSEYSLTLPFFVCQQWGVQCVAACASDSACASDCTQNHPCGAQNPRLANTTTSTATGTAGAGVAATGAAATSSGPQIFNGFAGATGSPGDSGATPVRVVVMAGWSGSVGLVALVGGLVLGGALVL